MGKVRGDFRSGLEYDVYMGSLKGTKATYESLKIAYIKPSTKHKYTPDWILPNGIIIEVKGRLTAADRNKHLLVQEQHPQLDIRFIIKYDNFLYKNAKKRYSDWFKEHNFKFAFKGVPPEWLKEKRRAIVFGAEKSSSDTTKTGTHLEP